MAADSSNDRRNAVLKLAGLLVVAGVLVAGSMLPVVGGIGLLAKTQSDKFLSSGCNLQETTPPQKTTLYANDGKTVLATLFTQDRQPVPLSQIPKYLTEALVATEDRRFYSHTGVDMRGLLRSALNTGSGDTQGGSTLTMQYVKQVRYYQAVTTDQSTQAEKEAAAKAQQAAISQTIDRKIEDANCALYLENVKHESKDTILDNYLNIAFFGENSYGIQAAAQNYFGKDVKDLTLPESAVLVGALQAPSNYDPYYYPVASKQRRNVVIQNLVEVGQLSQAEADKFKAEPITLTNTSPPVVHSDCSSAVVVNAGFFCNYVRDWLATTGTLNDHDLLTGGYKIVTTMDAAVQTSAQKQLSTAMPATSPATAIMPVLDPKTGNVLAMVTNKQFGTGPGQTENAIFEQASAVGASTFKYFTALAALKTGVPTDLTLNAPSPYTPTACLGGGKIANDSPAIPTTINMADAFARSSNTYFVGIEDKLFKGCDLTPVVKTAVDLGIDSLTAINDPTVSKTKTVADDIIQGSKYSFTIGYTVGPLELTSAYAVSANDGTYCPPAPVLSISDANGNSQQVKRAACVPKLAPQVARNMITLMQGDSKGVGTSAAAFQGFYSSGGGPIAGKTGTQAANAPNEKQNSAAWYVGSTPDLTAAMAIYDPAQPGAPLVGVPSAPDGQATGATAAGLWVTALGPSIQSQKWAWPDPNVMPGGVPVPNVVGKSAAEATAILAAAGFKLQDYGASYAGQLTCSGAAPAGSVAYQSPSIVATAGSTVTVCMSTGTRPYVPPTPVPTPRTTPAPPGAPPAAPAAPGAPAVPAPAPAPPAGR